MKGLAELVSENSDPVGYQLALLSDGQRRRNDAQPSAYWSEKPMVMRDGKVISAPVPPLPAAYFEAVKLAHVLEQIVDRARLRQWRLETAMRNLRSASASDWEYHLNTLVSTTANLTGAEERMRMNIEEMANTIDVIASPNPKGYVPHMGIHYAVAPLRKIMGRIKASLA